MTTPVEALRAMRFRSSEGVVFGLEGLDETLSEALVTLAVGESWTDAPYATITRIADAAERPLAGDEDVRGGAPRPPCEHAWRVWTARSGRRIHDCAICGDRIR